MFHATINYLHSFYLCFARAIRVVEKCPQFRLTRLPTAHRSIEVIVLESEPSRYFLIIHRPFILNVQAFDHIQCRLGVSVMGIL